MSGFTRDMDKGEKIVVMRNYTLDKDRPVTVSGDYSEARITFHEKSGRKARISVEANSDFTIKQES